MSLVSCESRDKFPPLFAYSCLSTTTNYYPHSTLQKLIFNSTASIYDNAFVSQPIPIEIQVMFRFVSHLPNIAAMNPIILFVLSSLFIKALSLKHHEPTKNNAQITVMGLVYCDFCSNNSFSRHSYFLPGAEVHIDCNFRAFVPKSSEQIEFSVNRTTDKHGVYRLEIPSVDGIACAEAAIASSCQASLVGSSSTSCNIPGYRRTTDQIAIKARHPNLCIYSLNALNFRPSKRDVTLCGNKFL